MQETFECPICKRVIIRPVSSAETLCTCGKVIWSADVASVGL